MQIWDTAGQERFRTITTAYYKGAQAVMMVCDVTNESTFKELENFEKDVKQHAQAGIPVTVVANKTDAGPRFRAVSRKDGKAFAKRIGARYAEVSAKTGQGVDEVFLELLNATVDPEARRTDAEVATHADPATPTSSAPPPFPPLGSDPGH